MRQRYARRHRAAKSARRKALDLALAVAVLGGLAVVAAKLERQNEEQVYGLPEAIHDGDTLTLRGQRIRLADIDAPELDQTCSDAAGSHYSCGQEARKALVRLVGNGPVKCSSGRQDQYRRLVATCFVGPDNLNRKMVAAGWAVATDGYWAEQKAACANRIGLWLGTFVEPHDWRQGLSDKTEAFNWLDWLFGSR